MSTGTLAFFTIDHGTASTAASLIAPLEGRFRLLATGTAPHGADVDAMLEDLVLRVEAIEPGLLEPASAWRRWARLESVTRGPRRLLCMATSERAAVDLRRLLGGRGWLITGRVLGGQLDPLDALAACLDPDLDALAVAAAGRSDEEQRLRARLLPLLATVRERRPDLPLLVCGPGDWPMLEGPGVHALPPADTPLDGDDPALDELLSGAALPGLADPDVDLPDGRRVMGASVATLAGLLDRRIEAVDIGHSGGVRVLAGPDGVERRVSLADAALVPVDALDHDEQLDDIVGWSTLRADPASLADRFRNLRLAPWRDVAGDGARLRSAALRAALGRLDEAWRDAGGARPVSGDMLICGGGAFAAVPAPAAALAVADSMRRPGVRTLFLDHARLLGPIGALPDQGDRRRLLVDLLDDVLLPLGSVIIVGDGRSAGRTPALLRVSSRLQRQEVELAPGGLHLVDLPPGMPAHVELEGREGGVLGLRSRRVALEVAGGLGGLLVDTREVPLRLPDRPERRRALLEAWERPVWGNEP